MKATVVPSLGTMRLRAFVASVAFAAAPSACQEQRFTNCSATTCGAVDDSSGGDVSGRDVSGGDSAAGENSVRETSAVTESTTGPVVAAPSREDPPRASSESPPTGDTEPTPSDSEGSDERTAPFNDGGLSSHSPPQPTTADEASTLDSAAVSSALTTTAETPLLFEDSLITNGDFSKGNAHWTVDRPNGPGIVSPDYSDERLCVSARTQAQFLVGWPEDPSQSLSLEAGSYRLSFRVRGQGGHLHAKVGHAYEPYNTWFESEWHGDESGWQNVSHDFTFNGDSAVGLAFTLELDDNSICLDDVSLQRQLTAAN